MILQQNPHQIDQSNVTASCFLVSMLVKERPVSIAEWVIERGYEDEDEND